jgi:Zn-dependent peptidase ImmA (M78 family)
MIKTNEIYNPYAILKEQDNINLVFKPLYNGLKGFIAQHKNDVLIVMDKRLSQIERRCVLAEELGHYFLGHSGNYFAGNYYGSLGFDKQEYDAKVWAADRLVDTEELLNIYSQDHQLTPYDIADYFWVTLDVLSFKIRHLVNLGKINTFYLPMST